MQYSIPKGTFDILPDIQEEKELWRSSERWQYLEAVIRKTAQEYGFKEIRTPIFERTELFTRSAGESSDIVSKEMYTFEDRGGRSLSLRPEGTASVMRAFVENQLQSSGPVHKLFYIGPMFRYERPQAGRYRQHHQFGAEAVGIGSPEQDVEGIDLLCTLCQRLGLKDLKVMINSLGDEASRAHYLQALRDYLTPYLEQLSPDSQTRFSKNILRILDSKNAEDQRILEKAPSLLDHLTSECKDHFERVKHLLKQTGITYEINPRLVRGLDYYNKTVFEVTSGTLGAQNSIGGGGRYDGMISSFGGPNLPAFGFGAGLERILHTMINQNVHFPPAPHPVIYLIPMGQAAVDQCFELLLQLRKVHIAADMDLSGKKIQHGLQRAAFLSATYAVVVGEEEMQTGMVQLKNMQTREILSVSFKEIFNVAKKSLG